MKQKTCFPAVFCSKNVQRAILTLSGMYPDKVGNIPDMVRESLTRVGSSFTCVGESLTMVGDSSDIPGILPTIVADYFTMVIQLPAYSEIMPDMVRMVLF